MNTSLHAASKLNRFLQFLAQDPDNLDLLVDTINLCLEAGDAQQGQALADRALSLYPSDHRLQHARALIAMRMQDGALAAQLLQGLVDAGEVTPAVRYNLAYSLYLDGRYEQAVVQLNAIEDKNAASPTAFALLVLCYHQLGELEEAARLAEEELKRQPENSELAGILAMVLLDDGDAKGSLRWSRRTLQLNPEQHHALICMGTIALGSGQAERASEYFQRVLAHNPSNGRAWSGLAFVLMYEQKFGPAGDAFEKAIRYMPGHIGTLHGYGWLKLVQSDIDGADALFTQALELDRNFGESHGAMAVIATLRGQHALADACLEKASRLAPDNLSAQYVQLLRAKAEGRANDAQHIVDMALAQVGIKTDASPDSEP